MLSNFRFPRWRIHKVLSVSVTLLFAMTRYPANLRKGRRLWAHYLKGQSLPWWGSHGHRGMRSPYTSKEQRVSRKWGLVNQLLSPLSVTHSLQWGLTPQRSYKLPKWFSTWSYRRQFTFNPQCYVKWILVRGGGHCPIEVSGRIEVLCTNSWHVSFEHLMYILCKRETDL